MAAQNIEVTEVDGKLVITIDPTKKVGPSASGKSLIIATTSGNIPVIVGKKEMVLGLNLYIKSK